MNRSIRKITESLTDLLPEDQEYYKLVDLREWGYPAFIVNRIRVELERNLAESMRLPQTDWANMQSETVQSIWEQFISAIRNEAWLPASYASTVVETAVGDVMEILVEPRKRIPDVLYATDQKLSAKELQQRVDVLVVYPHFANLLPRYLNKKKLDTLSKERCAEIVAKADQKITARYTPLNWAQLLEPLFQLFNEQIDSSLLRLFFEDKQMPRIARKFDFMDEPVDRAKLIETLSSPDSLNMMGYEDDQSELFGEDAPDGSKFKVEAPAVRDDTSQADEGEELDQDVSLQEEETESPAMEDNSARNGEQTSVEEVGDESESDRDSKPGSEPESENSINTQFSEEAVESGPEKEEEKEEPFSLNDNFGEATTGGTETEQDGQQSKPEDKEPPETEEVQEEKYTEPPDEIEKFQLTSESDDTDQDSMVDFSKEAKKETPMWQRFMSDEELEMESADESKGQNENIGERPEKAEPESADLEKPILDLTDSREPDEEEVERLRQALQGEKDYFVEKIFGGSERAYDEAVYELAGKRDWRSASRYLEKEVFQRNMVDMYSEQGIDLTDRLHNYFMKKADS